ncbi:MAG: NAD(P)/FAD-dependent oxidoreductase [Acidobacteria bacterium]|nr:NAD(P)/FAD-dependent oxidoreductase [Acidobacteriota bacterium]
MSVSEKQFDVAVIGGGPAGAVTALQAARSGLLVTLVDRGDTQVDRVGETIAPSSRAVLERLGLMAGFLAEGHLPCYANRSVWGRDGLDERHFISEPYGHGWHLDRKRFDRFLLAAAGDAGVLLQPRTSIKAFEPWAEGWRLRLMGQDGRRTALRARWVVDATGRAGWFARRLGVVRRVDDRLVGLAGFLGPSAQPFEDTTTLVEAVPDGWWYSALLPDGRLAAVYFTDADLVERNGATHPASWRKQLSDARQTTARIERHQGALPSTVRVVSAASACLETMAGSNWLAVGDAAVSYDPLSSCGIVTAMAGGMEAAAAIERQMSGDDGATERYSAHMRRSYERYRSMIAAYYRDETRWANHPFWKRRSADPVVTAAYTAA